MSPPCRATPYPRCPPYTYCKVCGWVGPCTKTVFSGWGGVPGRDLDSVIFDCCSALDSPFCVCLFSGSDLEPIEQRRPEPRQSRNGRRDGQRTKEGAVLYSMTNTSLGAAGACAPIVTDFAHHRAAAILRVDANERLVPRRRQLLRRHRAHRA